MLFMEGELDLDRENPLTLLGVNCIYMVTALLLVTLGYYLQMQSIYMGLIVTELVIVMLPVIIYVKWKGADPRRVFRLKGINMRMLRLCILITLCIYPVGLFLNLLGNLVLSMFGELIPVSIPVAENVGEYLVNILVIGLTAGVAEEVFFRGFILKGYEGFGQNKSIMISALLFGMFHFNIQNFIGPVFLGLVFGHMAVKTGSIAAPIAGHFFNNAISVTFMFAAQKLSTAPAQIYENTAGAQTLAAGLVFWGIFAAAGGMTARRLFRKLKTTRGLEEFGEMGKGPETLAPAPGFGDFIPVIITAAVFVAFCIAEVLMIVGSAS